MHDLSKLLIETDYYTKEFSRRGALKKYKSFLEYYEKIKETFSIKELEILSRNTPIYELVNIVKLDNSNILFNFLYIYLLLPNTTFNDVPISDGKESFCNIIIKEKIVLKDISWLLTYTEFLDKFRLYFWNINKTLWNPSLPYFFWIISDIYRSLLFYLLSKTKELWYKWIIVPTIINSKSMFNTWAFPKYLDWAFKIEWKDLVLSPTSEIQLTNLIQYLSLLEESLKEKSYRFSTTSRCFRMEDRLPDLWWSFFEFEKVELFTVCDWSEVKNEYKKMMDVVEEQLLELWLSYRIVLLADNDMWIASKITHDFEVYYPVSNKWVEVSSCSIHWDFASRRMNVKINWKYYHTLHWSALAIPRIIWCILEQYQFNWKEIKFPEVLKKYLI